MRDLFRYVCKYFHPTFQVWNLFIKHKVYAYVVMIALCHFLFLVFGSFVMWDWSYMDISIWSPQARVFFLLPWAFGFVFGDLLAGQLKKR